MRTIKIIKEDAVLLLIDFQERLMPAMENNKELDASVIKLIKGCAIMGTPSLVTTGSYAVAEKQPLTFQKNIKFLEELLPVK